MELFYGLLLVVGLAVLYGVTYVLNSETGKPSGCPLIEHGCTGCSIGKAD